MFKAEVVNYWCKAYFFTADFFLLNARSIAVASLYA